MEQTVSNTCSKLFAKMPAGRGGKTGPVFQVIFRTVFGKGRPDLLCYFTSDNIYYVKSKSKKAPIRASAMAFGPLPRKISLSAFISKP